MAEETPGYDLSKVAVLEEACYCTRKEKKQRMKMSACVGISQQIQGVSTSAFLLSHFSCLSLLFSFTNRIIVVLFSKTLQVASSS